MRREDLVDGMRLRIVQEIDIFVVGKFPKGAVGTLTLAEPAGWPEMIGTVKLDDHFPELDEWDNCLQLFNADYSECSPEFFEPVVGFV
jgi:hypothetical protein